MHVIRYVLIFAANSLLFDDSQKNGFSQEKTTSLPASWRLGGISTQKYFAFLLQILSPFVCFNPISIFPSFLFSFCLALDILLCLPHGDRGGFQHNISTSISPFFLFFASCNPFPLSVAFCVFLVTNRLIFGPDNLKHQSKSRGHSI